MIPPHRRVLREDGGFTLVESLLALVLAGVMFTALAGILVSSVKTSVLGRQNQQAADLMTQGLEQLRLLNHASLAHAALPSGGNVITCGATSCLAAQLNGVTVNEPLVVATGGAVTSSPETLVGTGTNQTTFTRRTYVTRIPGQPVDQAKRVTVFISWQQGGQTRTRSTSTIIAYTQRGLPVPVFKLQLAEPLVTKAPGARVTFELTLTNQGAPDRWDLTLGGAGAGLGWVVARDTPDAANPQGDGEYDPLVDVALTDTTGDGIIDTGRLDPSQTLTFFVTRQTAVTELSPVTMAMTVTATSVGQPPLASDPSTAGGASTVTATTTLTTAPVPPGPVPVPSTTSSPPPDTAPADCLAAGSAPEASVPSGPGGYSREQFVLHNDPQGDTPQQGRLYMNRTGGDEAWLGAYSNDVAPGVTGRHAVPFAATAPTNVAFLTSSDRTRYADWSFQTPKTMSVGGTAVLRLWVARAGATATGLDLRAVAFSATASGTELSRTSLGFGSATLGSLPCAGFQEVYVSIPLTTTSIPKNGHWGVRVGVIGTGSVRFAYDVPPTSTLRPYPARLSVATK